VAAIIGCAANSVTAWVTVLNHLVAEPEPDATTMR